MTKLEFTGYAYEIVNREHAEQVARINAEQMLAVSELSFIGASPNKAVVYRPQNPQCATLNYDGNKEEAPDNNLEWYGEFKRTRHEQENMEFYNQKDLV